ncbi:MAG: pseudouridine synthase [Candidatus Micrarchaeota archaeon]|nr:pseudouridine synthase [Candidatus Micrarchaeota archaeon]
MKRSLSNKERRQLGIKSKNAHIQSYKDFEVIVVDGKPLFLVIEGKTLPSLHNPQIELPSIEVDKGAVPFILKGAKVLRPGIVDIGNFNKGDSVVVKYQGVPIAIGIALVGSEEAREMEKGAVIKTVHYKGDALWKGTF